MNENINPKDAQAQNEQVNAEANATEPVTDKTTALASIDESSYDTGTTDNSTETSPENFLKKNKKPLILVGSIILTLIVGLIGYHLMRVPTMEEVDTAFNNKDTAKALKLLARMSEHGDSAAVYRLCDFYSTNEAEKIHWLRVGADKGIQSAMIDVGLLYIKHHRDDSAEYYLMKAAQLGNQQGQFQLSNFYHVTKKTDKLKQWALKAIEGPDRGIAGMACSNMALVYMDENKKDSALVYALKGANWGDGGAALSASHLLRQKGEFDQAIKYSRQAILDTTQSVKLRTDEAIFALHYYDSIKDYKTLLATNIAAAEAEIPAMQTLLALRYAFGDPCTDVDMAEAKKWIKRAADNGESKAKEFLPVIVYSSPRELAGTQWWGINNQYLLFTESGSLMGYTRTHDHVKAIYGISYDKSSGRIYVTKVISCSDGFEYACLKPGDYIQVELSENIRPYQITVSCSKDYLSGVYGIME